MVYSRGTNLYYQKWVPLVNGATLVASEKKQLVLRDSHTYLCCSRSSSHLSYYSVCNTCVVVIYCLQTLTSRSLYLLKVVVI